MYIFYVYPAIAKTISKNATNTQFINNKVKCSFYLFDDLV